jgi:hypothetical protein
MLVDVGVPEELCSRRLVHERDEAESVRGLVQNDSDQVDVVSVVVVEAVVPVDALQAAGIAEGELKRERMSSALVFGSPGFRSCPARLFASAVTYQVPGNSAPSKSLTTCIVPLDPSVPESAEQGEARKLA